MAVAAWHDACGDGGAEPVATGAMAGRAQWLVGGAAAAKAAVTGVGTGAGGVEALHGRRREVDEALAAGGGLAVARGLASSGNGGAICGVVGGGSGRRTVVAGRGCPVGGASVQCCSRAGGG